jgi:hypothetical protein
MALPLAQPAAVRSDHGQLSGIVELGAAVNGALRGFANFGSLGIMIAAFDHVPAKARRSYFARDEVDRLGYADDVFVRSNRRGPDLAKDPHLSEKKGLSPAQAPAMPLPVFPRRFV